MGQPLVETAGNALEVAESMKTLTGEAVSAPLWDLTVALGGELLALCGIAADDADGRTRIEAVLRSGEAAETFERMIHALGGPADFVGGWRRHLPVAPVVRDVFPEANGVVETVDTEAVGMAVVLLGGGRLKEGDRLDPSVGFDRLVGIGAEVSGKQPLARVHAANEEAADAATRAIRAAYRISLKGAPAPDLIHERIA